MGGWMDGWINDGFKKGRGKIRRLELTSQLRNETQPLGKGGARIRRGEEKQKLARGTRD